jgi:hypothetical protein
VRGRCHFAWDCPVASAVVAALALPRLPGGAARGVQRSHVWLLAAPPGYGGSPRQWRRVAMAAVAAMEYGRRELWGHWRAAGASAEAVAGVAALAVARFWDLLEAMPPLGA